jgi:lipoprotein-anchoring transpeptidase ErfK/SrfK
MLAMLIGAAAAVAAPPAKAPRLTVAESAATLGPGQYAWDAKNAPDGPVLITIDLTAQRIKAYRGGVMIGASSISTGSAGRETPTGAFTVLAKEVMHRSTTYDDAPMPYMQRLTEKGIAIHAGDLPGYPASHGCIRLPNEFAKLLFGVTEVGTAVMITDDAEIAAERKRIADHAQALDAYRQAKNAQQIEAARAMANYLRANAAHQEVLRQHDAEMARYRAVVAPR